MTIAKNNRVKVQGKYLLTTCIVLCKLDSDYYVIVLTYNFAVGRNICVNDLLELKSQSYSVC